MENCKPIATPFDANHQVKCTEDNCQEVNQHEYQSIIGMLIYLVITTRPDIFHNVSKLSERLKVYCDIFEDPLIKKIMYQAGKHSMKGFVDADWGGNALSQVIDRVYIFRR